MENNWVSSLLQKTIFTTNTSYLLPSQLASISGRPEKVFVRFHFHDVFLCAGGRYHGRMLILNPTLIPLLEELGRKTKSGFQ
jgi:3-hydroxybutyryl-CoA dehydrogenase